MCMGADDGAHAADAQALDPAAAGATIYASRDWLPANQTSVNTGALLFANTQHLPRLLSAWAAAVDRPVHQHDPDGFNELMASDSSFSAAVKLLPGCFLNDRPKSLVDRTFLAQMGCTGRTAALIAEADVVAAKRQADEATRPAPPPVFKPLMVKGEEELLPPQFTRAERRVVDRETYFGFWDTRYEYIGGGGKEGSTAAESERD